MNKKRALLAAFASLLALTGPMASADDAAHLTISRVDAAPRSVVLPLNKAIVVDLPVAARDVLLSNPDIADSVIRTPTRVFIIGRKMGQTNAFFFDASGRKIANLELRVEPDVNPLNDMFKRFAPNSSVRAESVNGALVLSGSVKSGADADRIVQIATQFGTVNGQKPELVNLLNVEGKEQVLVKVRVVEMSRSLVKQLGIDLSAQNIATAIGSPNLLFDLASSEGFSVSGKLLGGVTANAHNTSDNTKVDASIQAFERAGLLRVLAEPNLTAISGESAKFLAGGEFPIPVRANNGELSVEFKPFGVGLGFTPVVLSGGRISLQLSTEVSALSPNGSINTGDSTFTDANGQQQILHGLTIPALQVRRAQTTVEVPSGGSLMMAGLIQEETRQALEGLPGAKDIPVFGSLFRSRDYINNETELVIIVTPYLVEATAPGKIKTPADGFVNPSDMATILSNRLNAVYKGGSDAPGGKTLQGPAGHVIQ